MGIDRNFKKSMIYVLCWLEKLKYGLFYMTAEAFKDKSQYCIKDLNSLKHDSKEHKFLLLSLNTVFAY